MTSTYSEQGRSEPVGQGETTNSNSEHCSRESKRQAAGTQPGTLRDQEKVYKLKNSAVRGSRKYGAGYRKSEKVLEFLTGLKESYFSPEISQ